jgi:hypothetical protein
MGHSPEFTLDVPEVIGQLPQEQIDKKIEAFARERAKIPIQDVLPSIDFVPAKVSDASLEAFWLPWSRERPCWSFTDHAFGYIGLDLPHGKSSVDIKDAGNIEPETKLKEDNIRIRLDRLRVYEYPGGGKHNILFGFSAVHKYGPNSGDIQDLRFNKTYAVQEGSGAGVLGYPVFDGLRVAPSGVAFECTTVNVSNVDDNKLASFLNSDVFDKGMTVLNGFNPIIPMASNMATAILKAFAQRHENITVQHFQLGLDLDPGLTGAHLRTGSYIAVQVEVAEKWDWLDWIFDPKNGAVLSRESREVIPLNYVIFRVIRANAPETAVWH